MIIDNFGIMDRQGGDVKAICRFLLDGKVEGLPGNQRLVKLPGYENYVVDLGIQGGGSISPNVTNANSVWFKDPNHDYATSPTIFIIHSNTLYYWDADQSDWIAVVWKGNDAANFNEPRFWYERGILHIASGVNGKAAIYKYIDREKDTDKNGYFNNLEEYVGFWLGPEELPQFNMSEAVESIARPLGTVNNWSMSNVYHYMMGIYNCEGQESIYKAESFQKLDRGATAGDRFWIIEIRLDFSSLDERVTDIDFYAAYQKSTEVIGRRNSASDRMYNRRRKLRTHERRRKLIYQDEDELDWRFLKRLSINHDTEWVSSQEDSGVYVADNQIKINIDATDGYPPMNFKDDVLNSKFYIAAQRSDQTTWQYSLITDVEYQTPDADHVQFTTQDNIFTTGYRYYIKIISRWENVSGTVYKIYIMWRHESNDLGFPYDADQAYWLTDEYYPQCLFAAVQDRITYRLAPKTDEEHRAMLLWSEPDKPEVVPNGNYILLNTLPGEQKMGLEVVHNALLALYEKSVHYIRMTGAPVTYDAEEGRFDEGCISNRCVVNVNGTVFWLGVDGAKKFSGGRVIDLTSRVLKDDYLALIASQYTGGSSSYAAICGDYCPEKRLVIWSFPHSTLQIEGITVDHLCYDIDSGGFIFQDQGQNFHWIFTDYNGRTYGVSTNGFYKLFGANPDENTQMIWLGGKMMSEFVNFLIGKIRARYKGQITIEGYNETSASALITDDLGSNASIANKVRDWQLTGEDVQIKIKSENDANDCEVHRIELKEGSIEK